jgi:hypothetical protein
MATTVPDKIYVTLQYRDDSSNDDGLLGFMSPYTKDAAFEKRKDTQDNWAYGRGIKIHIDEDDNVTASGCSNHYRKSLDAATIFMTNCYPRILKNEPLEGFQIAKSVRRSGWSGSGNVTWRITDPRGFDLEIRSENFAKLVASGTLINGVIQGKCAWARDGSNNVLLAEDSEPYQSAVVVTSKLKNKIVLKDVQLGDTVDVMTGGKVYTAQYLGKMFFMYMDGIGNYAATGLSFGVQKESYLFKSDDMYFSISSSPKIISIEERIDVPLTKEEIAVSVNDWLSSGERISGEYSLYGISATKLKHPDEINIKLVKVKYTEKHKNGYSYLPYIYKDVDGTTYYNKERSVRDDTKHIAVEATIDKSKIHFKYTLVNNSSGLGYFHHNRHTTEYTNKEINSAMEIYEIHIQFGNNTVRYTG